MRGDQRDESLDLVLTLVMLPIVYHVYIRLVSFVWGLSINLHGEHGSLICVSQYSRLAVAGLTDTRDDIARTSQAVRSGNNIHAAMKALSD